MTYPARHARREFRQRDLLDELVIDRFYIPLAVQSAHQFHRTFSLDFRYSFCASRSIAFPGDIQTSLYASPRKKILPFDGKNKIKFAKANSSLAKIKTDNKMPRTCEMYVQSIEIVLPKWRIFDALNM